MSKNLEDDFSFTVEIAIEGSLLDLERLGGRRTCGSRDDVIGHHDGRGTRTPGRSPHGNDSESEVIVERKNSLWLWYT
jgi:hypothetical protein